jgi:4-amino-4-deoxy-L-arabinose transferase-like glycosyltransferase
VKKHKKYSLLIPIFFFLFNVILRSFGIEINSLAGDEPYSVYYAQMDIVDILRHMRPGNNPPLYEVFLHFWEGWFGIGEVAVRVPSLIFTGLTAAFIYKIGNEFFSKSTGVIAGLLYSFSNYATLFSHEARVYALFGMLTCVSFYLFLRWLNDRYSKKTIILLFIVNALLLYSHYFGVMVMGLQVGLAVLFCYRDLNKLKWVGVSVAASLILFLPYIPIVLEQFSVTKEKGTWLLPPNGWPTVEYMLMQFANSKTVVYLVVGILGVAALFNLKKIKTVSRNTWVVLAWFSVPFFGMFFISYEMPMFHNRYLMHTFIGFILLLSIASLSIVRFPFVKLSIPVILVFCFFLKSERNIDNGRHSKEAVAKVQELRDENTRVVMYPKYRILGYSYYFNKERFKNFDAEFGFYNVLEGFKDENFYGINQYSEARIDSSVSDVIFMMTDGGPKDQLLQEFGNDFSLKESHNYPEIIDVYKFERK